MKNSILSLAFFLGVTMSTNGFASDPERIDHFEGATPHTVEEAKALLSEYNKRLATLLASDPLTVADLGQIHKLTYTLENALNKIRQEYDALAETLETLHQASETAKIEETKELGKQYLESSHQLVD